MSRAENELAYDSGHSQRADAIDPVEARDALATVESVRTRLATSNSGESQWAVPAALLFGLATFATLQGSLWGFFLVGLVVVGLIVHSISVKKPVRAALKQEVRPDSSGFSWKGLVPLFIMYPLAMWLPQGNTAVSAIAGLCVAGAMLAVHYRWKTQNS